MIKFSPWLNNCAPQLGVPSFNPGYTGNKSESSKNTVVCHVRLKVEYWTFRYNTSFRFANVAIFCQMI